VTRILCALAVLCLGGLATGVSPALGAFPGDNGRIAFSSDRDSDIGDVDIWTMRPNGTNPLNLTADSEGTDAFANWRADGRKLVFMSDRVTATNPEGDLEIFVMNADGSHLRQITFSDFDDENPAWSPDGKTIVFQRDFDPVQGQVDYDLLTMKADGSNEQNLTNSPGIDDIDPNWSPNGRRIAFSGDRDGDLEVYTIRPNGSGERQLTFNDGPIDEGPNWSPDGRMITFDSDRDATAETPFQFEIYKMRADGDDQTRLTFHDFSDFWPAWSPNGRQIVFTSFRAELVPENDEIFTMRPNGSGQMNRTNNPAFDFAPDWQPLDDDKDDRDNDEDDRDDD
jgi:Tol biopolymer transport system component